jgi:hypothetical protein
MSHREQDRYNHSRHMRSNYNEDHGNKGPSRGDTRDVSGRRQQIYASPDRNNRRNAAFNSREERRVLRSRSPKQQRDRGLDFEGRRARSRSPRGYPLRGHGAEVQYGREDRYYYDAVQGRNLLDTEDRRQRSALAEDWYDDHHDTGRTPRHSPSHDDWKNSHESGGYSRREDKSDFRQRMNEREVYDRRRSMSPSEREMMIRSDRRRHRDSLSPSKYSSTFFNFSDE